MPRKKADKVSDVESTETENDTMTAATETDANELQINVGVTAPKRTRNGAGRSRNDNPFDAIMEDLYNSGEWAGVAFTSDEQLEKFQRQLKNAAQHAGYGLDQGVDENEPGVLKFHVRDKVEGRGRKPGSKKIDGHFYSPDELDAEGNPTAEARAAKGE